MSNSMYIKIDYYVIKRFFCSGMKYLHYGVPDAIVHGDLKSLNGM